MHLLHADLNKKAVVVDIELYNLVFCSRNDLTMSISSDLTLSGTVARAKGVTSWVSFSTVVLSTPFLSIISSHFFATIENVR